MKAGISFLLGLLLAFVLVFAYWLWTPHSLGTQWIEGSNQSTWQAIPSPADSDTSLSCTPLGSSLRGLGNCAISYYA